MKGVTKYHIFLGSDTQRCKLLMRKDVDNFFDMFSKNSNTFGGFHIN